MTELLRWMAVDAYMGWYAKDVAPHLDAKQKEAVMRRISDMTLESAIWLDRETDYTEQFPELKPYSHTKTISGLQLCAVMEGIFKELHPEQHKSLAKFPWS